MRHKIENNSIVLCYTPALSSKYWRSLFAHLKEIFQSPIVFVDRGFEGKLKMENLISWSKTNYPNCKIIFFDENYFQSHNQAFNGYADGNVALVRIQPELMVPLNCRSEKFTKVSWYNATLVAAVHEIAHMFELNHCSSQKCVMAKLSCKSNSGYCWPCVARRSKFYRSRIFCDECYTKLRFAEVATSD
jgi:hypothetical protein